MKEFFKFTFATIVGLLITGAIVSVFGIIVLMGVAASSDAETTVKENSVYVLDLEGVVSERSQENPFGRFLGNSTTVHGLDDIVASIRKAKENKDIKGICLNAGGFSCSSASMQEIRRALGDFKTSGKFIIAYGDSYTQSSYYLASIADKVILNPSGSISWHGMASRLMFYKDLMKKVGVEMQVFRVGTYKSAVEPYIANEMSAANKEQTRAYVQSIWNRILNDVSASRHISVDSLNILADRNMDYAHATEYIRCGLADTLMYKDQLHDYLKTLTGVKDEKKRPNVLTMSEMIHVKETKEASKSKNKIAVYYAYGSIDDAMDAFGSEGIHSEKVMIDLRKLREDDNVKAVVLRVNSPGGSAYGSEQIWREVSLLKEKKPVIVSMGDYAASGGYYISCAADWIVAEATTLTGSIGIFGMIPDPSRLLTETLNLHFDGVKTNRLADMGAMGRPLNTEERALFQNMVNDGYELFTRRCAEGRKMPVEEIKKIAEGRVWTGEMAKELKLVDQLGGLDDAIAAAADRANLEDYSVERYPEQMDFLTSLLSNVSPERYIQEKVKSMFGDFGQTFLFLKNIDKVDRLQARMPFDIMFQ